MERQTEQFPFRRFDLRGIVQSFPDTSDTLLLDTYLTDEESASSRVFRVYRPTPPHYHANSDEHLYVLSGTGTFWMGEPSNRARFGPGDFLFFRRGTVHAQPDIFEGPVVFLAIDTPRRDPKDIIFVNLKTERPKASSIRSPLVETTLLQSRSELRQVSSWRGY